MTSNDRDEKTRLARYKLDRLYERLGPTYRDMSPDFHQDAETWLDFGPDIAHNIAASISKGADFNISQVLIQQVACLLPERLQFPTA